MRIKAIVENSQENTMDDGKYEDAKLKKAMANGIYVQNYRKRKEYEVKRIDSPKEFKKKKDGRMVRQED